MKIQSTTTCSSEKIKILVYGEAGVGKTTLAGTIDEPTLIISAESGLLCLKDKNIDVIDISVDDDGKIIPKEKRIGRLGEVYSFLLTEECKTKYKWIFIDSLTEISQNLIEKLNSDFPDRKDSLVMYGENSKQLRSIVKSFRDIPYYNVVMTALAEPDKDDNGKRFMNISLVGNFSSKISAYFDEVFYLNTNKDGERCFITEKVEGLQCKDRSGKLSRFEKPSLLSIKEKICC